MSRKIIQIFDSPVTDGTNGYITALCDDGTVWYYSGSKWYLIKEQIPQDDLKELLE